MFGSNLTSSYADSNLCFEWFIEPSSIAQRFKSQSSMMISKSRKERNAIFHTYPNPDKRIITKDDAENCISILLNTFQYPSNPTEKFWKNCEQILRYVSRKLTYHKNYE